MRLRRIPVGRLSVLLALGVGLVLLGRSRTGPHWRTVHPGVEFATVRGEPYCRRGSADVAVLRVDPARARLRAHHYTREPELKPLTIVEWQKRLDAIAVFNAGQYYPDHSYMGLFVSGGEIVSKRPHAGFRAALVAGPHGGDAGARVLDLDADPFDPVAPEWEEVAQSFMLFDRSGHTRVRKSERVSNRTVVGEDAQGRIVVLTSEGGYTLWDFAQLLRERPLGLTHAMVMDGGYEAELCVDAGSFRYASFGRWSRGGAGEDAPGARVRLPAVISVGAP